jgi:hypothetical protein
MRRVSAAIPALLCLGFLVIAGAWILLFRVSGVPADLGPAAQFAAWDAKRVEATSEEELPASSASSQKSRQEPWYVLSGSDRFVYLIPWAWLVLPWLTAGYLVLVILTLVCRRLTRTSGTT